MLTKRNRRPRCCADTLQYTSRHLKSFHHSVETYSIARFVLFCFVLFCFVMSSRILPPRLRLHFSLLLPAVLRALEVRASHADLAREVSDLHRLAELLSDA